MRRFEVEGGGEWYGGGADLTPAVLHERDAVDFHRFWRDLCDGKAPELRGLEAESSSAYGRYKAWCDEYFEIPARNERRGIGGIFFDDLDAPGAETFTRSVGAGLMASYLPLAARRGDTPFSDAQRRWQLLRRGRYVEFNLLYDRGVRFGLQGGRMESIMVSAPPAVAWGYNESVPEQGTEEYETWKFLTMDEPAVDWADRKMAE